jgi:hypothetical protein
VAAPHAKFPEPAPDTGRVGRRPDRLVSLDGLGEMIDGTSLIGPAGVPEAEVFQGGGPGPRVGIPLGRGGQAHRVLAGQAEAVRRDGADSGVPGVVGVEGSGDAGDGLGQLGITRG